MTYKSNDRDQQITFAATEGSMDQYDVCVMMLEFVEVYLGLILFLLWGIRQTVDQRFIFRFLACIFFFYFLGLKPSGNFIQNDLLINIELECWANLDTRLLHHLWVTFLNNLEFWLGVGHIQYGINVRVSEFSEFYQIFDQSLISLHVDWFDSILILRSLEFYIVTFSNDWNFHFSLLWVIMPRRLG
jgi:hypothetical protein